ncbi:conserved hypothetical protein [Parafrankia sp. Ea1.12]|nr:conserved hypothetical protein [Parafrankia sp. Ea1.12]
MPELHAQHPGRQPLELVGDRRRGVLRVKLDEQVHMVGHDLPRNDHPLMPGALPPDQLRTAVTDGTSEHRAAELRAPHPAIPKVVDTTRAHHHPPNHDPNIPAMHTYGYGPCPTPLTSEGASPLGKS